ncbi:hypothetical protein ACF0H5_014799 [Mactra antiquata]
MGNVEVHDLSPVREDERKELNLSRQLNYKQYCRHVEGFPSESCLREIPWNIRDSLSLFERMNVAFNSLTELPKEIPLRLPHLSYLDLSHNQLETLPESFGLLFHLETVRLNYNKLITLPNSFYHLIKLSKLDLSHNCLKSIPNECIHLECLEKLNVSHNKLKALPTALGGLKSLKVLIANNNRLQEPFLLASEHGSDELLSQLRKSYNLRNQCSELLPSTSHNVFPRIRGNHLHTSVPNPHSAQVQYIQSQTHTANTSCRIKTPLLPPPDASSLDAYDLRDRILGLIYGAAIGDAVGIATCCMCYDECKFHYNTDIIHYADIIQDEVRVRWKQGDWTSNFDTMVLLLDSIINWAGVIDELEYAKRLHTWCRNGYPELGDKNGIILSETVKQVIENSEFLKHPHLASAEILEKSTVHVYGVESSPSKDDDGDCSVDSSCSELSTISDMGRGPLFPSSHPSIPSIKFGTDNGAITSIAILGVPYFHVLNEVETNTVRICKTTHSRPLCIASCVMVTHLVAQMLQGRTDLNCSKTVDEMIEQAATMATKHLHDENDISVFNSYINKTVISSIDLGEQFNMSFTLKALSAGLIALKSQQTFKSFMMSLFMEGGDSNSVGCVTGALLGCKVGYSHLPQEWIQGLRQKQTTWLNTKINHFLDMIGLP